MSPSGGIPVKVRFASLLQRHTGVLDVEMVVPPDPEDALARIIESYGLPWEDTLKKSTGVFINRIPASRFIRENRMLSEGDTISFIPMVGGG
jgi:molybdopterin converting factor small subunit